MFKLIKRLRDMFYSFKSVNNPFHFPEDNDNIKRCSKCGIKLENMMYYICQTEKECPSGLKPDKFLTWHRNDNMR